MKNHPFTDPNSQPTQDNQPHTPKLFRIIAVTIGGIFLAALFGLLFGFLVKWLWNWLMPAIFNLPLITYWQAFGIVILAKLLFGSFGHHYHDNPCYDNHRQYNYHSCRSDYIHKKVNDRWHRWMGFTCHDHDDNNDGDVDDDDDDELWKPKGSHKNWKYYPQYWKKEGKTAFENYIDRVKKEDKQ